VLLLAGDLPQRLPQELMLAHHGRLHDWRGPAGAKAWQPLDDGQHPQWVIDSAGAYGQGLPSAMFSLPLAYWRFLEHATSWAAQDCLILARAPGWSSLAEMREHAAESAEVKADAPPVNFHWLAQQLPRLGARALPVHASRGDAVQLVAAHVAAHVADGDAVLPALGAPLAAAARSGRADRARALRVVAGSGDLAAALAVLQHSGDDPLMLRTAWDALAPAADAAGPLARTQLGAWLERVLSDNPWIGDDTELLRAAGHLAFACGRIDLSHTALQFLHQFRRADAADIAALARCREQLGRFAEALAACEEALSLQAGQADALATRERVQARLAALDAAWRVQEGSGESPLLLDPLHADHAPMLRRQMRDPAIPAMTALPALDAADDGRGWIQARLQDSPATYAIVHRQLGFVGYIDMRLWETTAFVCYWIGPDFQGMGFCPPAIELARGLAHRNGVELLLSSAYDDNARSLRSLRRCGFRDLDVRALPPDGDRTFVMLPLVTMEEDEAARRLVEFCKNTGSGLQFDAAAQDAHRDTSSEVSASQADQ
jgi:RimJ/RimL family protein N-acetyltransferase